MGACWRWALATPDGVAPSRMFDVSASVNLPLHRKVQQFQKFSSGTGSPWWSRKKGRKMVVVLVVWIRTLKVIFMYRNWTAAMLFAKTRV